MVFLFFDSDTDTDSDFAGAQSYGMLTHFCHDRHRLFAVTLRLGRDFIAIGIGIAIGIVTLSLHCVNFPRLPYLVSSSAQSAQHSRHAIEFRLTVPSP
jgi:membrane protein insertase Oxa1/YidC/SpoIIIJ